MAYLPANGVVWHREKIITFGEKIKTFAVYLALTNDSNRLNCNVYLGNNRSIKQFSCPDSS